MTFPPPAPRALAALLLFAAGLAASAAPRDGANGGPTLVGRFVFRIGNEEVPPTEIARAAGYEWLELEVAGVSVRLPPDGQVALVLDPGERRLDHLWAVNRQEERRAIFFPAATVEVELTPEPVCAGTWTLTWKNRADLAHDGFPFRTLTPNCPEGRFETPRATRDGLPELADPVWMKLLTAPYVEGSGALSRTTFLLVPAIGLRYPLLRDPGAWGTLWVSGRVGFEPTATPLSAGLEWGPWHGHLALTVEGGIVADAPHAGAGLLLGTLKREAALFARVDLLFPRGFDPEPRLSFGLQLAPVALLGAFL